MYLNTGNVTCSYKSNTWALKLSGNKEIFIASPLGRDSGLHNRHGWAIISQGWCYEIFVTQYMCIQQ